jgi:small-conductance mechanosensitive channel
VISLPCSVAYGLDLELVERVAIEVAKAVITKTAGADTTFEPIVRFGAFADSSINFNLILRVNRYVDSGMVKHQLIKEIHARFIKDGIEMPFPQRVIHWNPPA